VNAEEPGCLGSRSGPFGKHSDNLSSLFIHESGADQEFAQLYRATSDSSLRVRSIQSGLGAFPKHARMMTTGIDQYRIITAANGHLQDSLMSQIQAASAATLRATVRREGE